MGLPVIYMKRKKAFVKGSDVAGLIYSLYPICIKKIDEGSAIF